MILSFLALLSLALMAYRKLAKNLDFFKDKPIPSLPAVLLYGSTGDMLQKKIAFSDFIVEAYNCFPGTKVFGLVDTTTPVYVIRDLELIKQLTTKDFDYFMDRRPMFGRAEQNDNTEVLCTKTIASLAGDRWRNMRATLSPAFTGSKMRAMFILVVEYCKEMASFYSQQDGQEYEWKEEFGRIANDIIATSAFGLSVNSLRNKDNEFYLMGKQMLDFGRAKIALKVLGYRLAPGLMKMLSVDILDSKPKRYFAEIIKEAVKTRDAHGIVRPDMIHLLMQARKGVLQIQKSTEQNEEGFATVQEAEHGRIDTLKEMTDSEMVAQCLIFFLAGLDTVSTALSLLAYELALNEEVQQKLHGEIILVQKSLKGETIDYDTLQKMKYMDMVVSETLRKWPPVPVADRICIGDYTLNDGDGLKFTIEKDTCLWIPIQGIHRDAQYFPNPEKFDPERFNEINRAQISPGSYLPFGTGPRNCIGSRLALMEIKAILYYMLQKLSFERSPATQVPIQYAKGVHGVAFEQGVQLKLRVRPQ